MGKEAQARRGRFNSCPFLLSAVMLKIRILEGEHLTWPWLRMGRAPSLTVPPTSPQWERFFPLKVNWGFEPEKGEWTSGVQNRRCLPYSCLRHPYPLPLSCSTSPKVCSSNFPASLTGLLIAALHPQVFPPPSCPLEHGSDQSSPVPC